MTPLRGDSGGRDAPEQQLPPPGSLRGRLAPEAMYPAGVEGITSRFIRLQSGGRVRIIESGPVAGPIVMLLHGWGGCVYTFRRTIPSLTAAGCRVIAADLFGHGLSDKPLDRGTHTLDAMVAHVDEILTTLDIPCAALVGHSMGGAIALRFAAEHPARVSHVGLLASARLGRIGFRPLLSTMSRERAAAISPYFCTRGTIALILWIAHANRARFTWHDVDEYWAPTQYPEALQSAWALIREFSWRAPSDDELKAVTAPCLVMVGTADRVIAPNEAEDFARRMPNATFRSLRNEGHLFVESSAEVTNQEILRLLAR